MTTILLEWCVMAKIVEKVISWSFYLLFLLVPLWFYASNSELFEYNKMVLTYGLTIIIATAWLVKLINNHKLSITNWVKSVPRTPLDIPIALYLVSHLLSTIFSLDPHVSFWGYYSRFHEGLLATISYLILYYAAISNLNRSHVINILKVSFVSAAIVSLWGALEHFGHSPSCLLITGNFDVSCWVQDVQGRVFATLGQPNWMAAYLDVIILILAGFLLQSNQKNQNTRQSDRSDNQTFRSSDFLNSPSFLKMGLFSLTFAGLLFTKSRSGLLGLAIGLFIFGLVSLWQRLRAKNFGLVAGGLLIVTVIFGLPFTQTEKFSLESLVTRKPVTTSSIAKPQVTNPGYIDIGISESGDIRKVVWTGAVKVWQRYPIFGSGVETFAYAYYKDRPVSHNLLSEWDYLYNKAHNEFLNILATTGTVGFLSYLSILGAFTLWFIRNLKQFNNGTMEQSLTPALFAAWVSILVTNFFGFSVVIIGLYFFLIPAFVFILCRPETESARIRNQSVESKTSPITSGSWILIALINLISLVLLINLVNMWQADIAYAYGKNLDSVNHYVQGYRYLKNSVQQNPDEPVFRDELASNESILAAAIFQQASGSAQEKLSASLPQFDLTTKNFADQAVSDSNQVVQASPNAMPFWKTRTRVFYELGTINPRYYLEALAAIQKAADLAPTDAKVHYNLGIIQGRTNQIPAAIKTFEETVAMKPDYRDAYYALALYYDQAGDTAKAKSTMQLILSRIGPDAETTKWLTEHK